MAEELEQQQEQQAPPEQETEQAPELAGETPEPEQGSEPLLAGKYQSVEDLEKAYLEAQETLGRQGQELGKYRQTQYGSPEQQNGYDPLTISQAISNALPSDLAYAETLPPAIVAHMQQRYGLTPEKVSNLSEVDWMRYQLREERHIEARQAEQSRQAEQVVQQFTATYADLAPYMREVQGIDNALTASGAYGRCQTEQEAYDLLARTARAALGLQTPVADAARLLGQRGGQAAAQARQTPPPPGGGTLAGGTGGAQRTGGIVHSAFEDLTDWTH